MKVLDLEKLAVWTFMMMTTTTCALGSDLPKAGAADDALFWSGKTYVQLDALSLPSDVLQKQCPLHDRDNRKKKYLPSLAESMQYNRYGTLLSFLLRRSFDAEKKNTYLPVVLLKEEGRDFACVTNSDTATGIIYQYVPSEKILSQGLYHSSLRLIPQNGSYYDKAALSLAFAPICLGFDASSGRFKALLFSENGKTGRQAVLEGGELSSFALKERGSGSLKLQMNSQGNFFLPLENTLLSGSSYVNYGFYTEPEMLLLKDLGFEVRPREFIGTTVWSQGRADDLVTREIKSGFFAYSERNGVYDVSRASVLPLTIGTHVMGSYNEIMQNSSVIASGAGSAGVRIDGSGNVFTQDKNADFVENGYDSAGVAVVYGHGNSVNLKGNVQAEGSGGIGVFLGFGSNLHSDLKEYRGSYLRVCDGKDAPLPKELNGALVDELRISGSVSGRKAAIMIGDLAHVEHIRLENGAKIFGDIVSKWEPYFDGGSFKVFPKESSHIVPGRLELGKLPSFDDDSAALFIRDRLHTKIFLGELEGAKGSLPHPDPRARVDIRGNIDGKTLDLIVSGGESLIMGTVDISSLQLRADSILDLAVGGSFSLANYLDMRDHSVLNFVNGVSDELEIKKKAYFADTAVLRLDAYQDGSIADNLILPDDVAVSGGSLCAEPGLSYAQIRSFNASPRDFMNFMERFVADVRKMVLRSGLEVSFPKHVWYENGMLGMEVKCSSRGCRAGRVISSARNAKREDLTWRYCLSGAGSVLLLFLLFLYFSYERHNGRVLSEKRAEHELSAIMKTDEARG